MIGVLGGTFDPLHIGHLRIAIEMQEQLSLERVLLIPSHNPPHREQPEASPAQRFAMVQLALQAHENIQVDDREMQRSGPSYMVDTLESLHADCPGQALCLILGMDAFLGLESWSRWQPLLDLAHLIILDRPDFEPVYTPQLHSELQQKRIFEVAALHEQRAGLIYLARVTQLAVSASDIRARVRAGAKVDYLVPDAVNTYIKQHNIYTG